MYIAHFLCIELFPAEIRIAPNTNMLLEFHLMSLVRLLWPYPVHGRIDFFSLAVFHLIPSSHSILYKIQSNLDAIKLFVVSIDFSIFVYGLRVQRTRMKETKRTTKRYYAMYIKWMAVSRELAEEGRKWKKHHCGREKYEGNKRKFIDKSFTHQIFSSFASFWRWIFQKAYNKYGVRAYMRLRFSILCRFVVIKCQLVYSFLSNSEGWYGAFIMFSRSICHSEKLLICIEYRNFGNRTADWMWSRLDDENAFDFGHLNNCVHWILNRSWFTSKPLYRKDMQRQIW